MGHRRVNQHRDDAAMEPVWVALILAITSEGSDHRPTGLFHEAQAEAITVPHPTGDARGMTALCKISSGLSGHRGSPLPAAFRSGRR